MPWRTETRMRCSFIWTNLTIGHANGFSPTVLPYLESIPRDGCRSGLDHGHFGCPAHVPGELVGHRDHGHDADWNGSRGNSIEERRVFVIASGMGVDTELVTPDTLSVVGVSENCLGSLPRILFQENARAVVPESNDFVVGTTQDFTVECRVKTTQAADVAMVGNKGLGFGIEPGLGVFIRLPFGSWLEVECG